MQELLQNLNDYDLSSLRARSSRWEDLLVEEKYFCVQSCLLLYDVEAAHRLIQQHKAELMALGVDDLLCLLLSYDKGEDYSQSLFNCLDLAARDSLPPLVLADFYFGLGYVFMRDRNFRLAENFQKSSLEIFSRYKVEALIWRAQFNISLCQQQLAPNASSFVGMDELLTSFLKLHEIAQVYLSRPLVWFLLYRGHLSEAREIVEKMASNSLRRSDGFEVFSPLKYLVYLNELAATETDFQRDFCMETPEQRYFKEMSSLKTLAGHSYREIVTVLESWEEIFNRIDRWMLTHVLLNYLSVNRSDSLLLEVFRLIESSRLNIDRFLIPPKNIYSYAVLASKRLKKPLRFEHYMERFSTQAPKHEMKSLLEEVSEIEKNQNQREIKVFPTERQLSHSGRRISFENKRRSFQLFVELSKKSHQSISELYFRIYEEKFLSQNRSKLMSLIQRSVDFMNMENLIVVTGDEVALSKSYRLVLRPPSGWDRKQRWGQVLKILQSQTQGLSAQELAQSTGVSSRTLVKDLSLLMARGQIVKLGKGRSTRYQLA